MNMQFRVVRNTNKVLLNKELLQEIFYPTDASNLETDFLIEELSEIFTNSLLLELTNTRKAIQNHLSMVGRKYS